MAVIKRLDHVIVAVRDRTEWIPRIEQVLELRPGTMRQDSGSGSGGFSNAEFAIGDGFLGVVEPSGSESQLHRFLDRFGDGSYGMSIDVGDVPAAQAAFARAEIDVRQGGGLTWAGPRRTHGVVYQVIDGMLLGPGTNPRMRGLSRLTIAVHDLATAVADYERAFEFATYDDVTDDGVRSAVFHLEGSALDQRIVLTDTTDPAAARVLSARGEGIVSFGIATDDLGAERVRLERLGIGVRETTGAALSIDPAALGGLLVDLEQRP